METTEKQPHIGRKIVRIRELRGIKQDVLATELGFSQQKMSRLEASETVEEEVLENVARILGVSAEAIKHFSEESVFNYFNSFHDSSEGTFNNHCTFNPLDKLIEAYDAKEKLYERLLKGKK